MNRVIYFILLLLLIVFTGCKSKQTTIAQPEKKNITLPLGYWNTEDSRIVAEKLVKRMLADRWRTEYLNVHKNARPILIVGIVQNLSTENIDTSLFLKDIEKSIIKGDLVRFVQSGNKKSILMSELTNADTLATITKWAGRMGANFVVNGVIGSTEELKRREKTVNYRIKLELINCETQQIVWLGEEILIKKITE